jgi:hypothetical protein
LSYCFGLEFVEAPFLNSIDQDTFYDCRHTIKIINKILAKREDYVLVDKKPFM